MKIPIKEKIGYSIGEYAGSLVWQTLIFFLPVFYTDTYGLSTAEVGTLFIVVRLFDSMIDPIMGSIADRTNTRWGKFRPYILFMALPYGIAGMIMFTTPDLSHVGKLIYAYTTYNIMMIIYSMMMVPYNSLSGVISSDSDERTSLSSYRFVVAYAAGISIQWTLFPLVKYFGQGNDAIGYKRTMGIVSLICIICFIVTFVTTKERVQPDPNVKTSMKHDLKDLLSNKPWLILFSLSFITLVFLSIRGAVIVYYFAYYIGNKNLSAAFMALGTFLTLLGVLPTRWLSQRFSKRMLLIVCYSIVAIATIVSFWMKSEDIVLIFTLYFIYSLGCGPIIPLLWSMYADSVDYSEWKTGRRATGLTFAAATFGQKAGNALGSAIAMWILYYFGYKANIVQSLDSILGIKLVFSIAPVLFIIAAVGFSAFYKLDRNTMQKVEVELNKRKGITII
jgi:GPH family glycoside/pentoside/hexuronide:cation symporter